MTKEIKKFFLVVNVDNNSKQNYGSGKKEYLKCSERFNNHGKAVLFAQAQANTHKGVAFCIGEFTEVWQTPSGPAECKALLEGDENGPDGAEPEAGGILVGRIPQGGLFPNDFVQMAPPPAPNLEVRVNGIVQNGEDIQF